MAPARSGHDFTADVSSLRGVPVTPRSHPLNSEAYARRIADSALDRKALDVVVLDLRGRSAYAEFIVIASGTSDRHVQSIAEHAEAEETRQGHRSIGSEGLREGQWALIDFGSVVLHVFHQYTRELYDLETMWRDSKRLALAEPARTQASR